MTVKNAYIVGVFVLSVLLLAGFVSAGELTDDTDDVLHWKWNENLGVYKWAHSVTSKPNIDITELLYTIEGQKITIEMKVEGTIENSEKVVYIAYYNTTDATYWISYNNGTGTCLAFSNDYTQFATENATASGDTISATVDVVGTGQEEEFWGYAAQYAGEIGVETAEWWGDWVPEDFAPEFEDGENGENGEEGDDNGGTPGFELALLVVAIIGITLLKRRNKKLC